MSGGISDPKFNFDFEKIILLKLSEGIGGPPIMYCVDNLHQREHEILDMIFRNMKYVLSCYTCMNHACMFICINVMLNRKVLAVRRFAL